MSSGGAGSGASHSGVEWRKEGALGRWGVRWLIDPSPFRPTRLDRKRVVGEVTRGVTARKEYEAVARDIRYSFYREESEEMKWRGLVSFGQGKTRRDERGGKGRAERVGSLV